MKAACLAVIAVLSGCNKKKAEPVPAAPTDGGSVPIDATPAPTDAASASPTDAAAAAGSGSATPAATDAATPAPDALVAKLDLEAKSEICSRVVEKLADCRQDPEFIAALTAGLTGADLKDQRKYLAKSADWPPAFCDLWEYDWEFNGFRDQMERLTDPKIVTSCATLGSALKAAGGLTGGEMVK